MAESHGHPLVIYIKATVVVFVRPSVCLAGQGRASRAGVVVSVRPSVLQGRAGQGRGGQAGRPDIFSYAENNGFLAAIRI